MGALDRAIRTVWPPEDARHGPLPRLLVLLTFATGLVDAVSYLMLGHVFVGNMTGNVVLLGFALGGGAGLSVVSSLLALVAFLAGAAGGGRLGRRIGAHRGHLLRAGVATEGALLAVAVVVALATGDDTGRVVRDVLIVLLALAMGLQTAVARSIGVPGLTTTVLTSTLTGIAADARLAGGSGLTLDHRALAVVSMLLGALAGTVLALRVALVVPLALAFATIAAAGVVVHRRSAAAAAADWADAGP
ncbi:MAG: hypothetical protein JWQ48_3082 [Conexibacter sp.]|nr:hypothetical protein [Conexibacter sp.]